jgi:hypothetical protein
MGLEISFQDSIPFDVALYQEFVCKISDHLLTLILPSKHGAK